ncbi:Imm61 family immunity protein [Mycolicibacterium mengxianglii]|uniref:Imm61 family immunity protein n=1 Tax=Mycolicibacterium mengxianglii TaxID=2736649 RepID=UPI0018D1D50C
MKGFLFPSGDLIGWAAEAGYSYSRVEDGTTALFYNRGGKDRYFVRPWRGGLLRITSSSRAGSEEYEVDADACNQVAAEAFFWMTFGPTVREGLNLARLMPPVTRESVASPFRIDDSDESELRLVGKDGRPAMVVTGTWDPVSDVARLVISSWALNRTPDEIRSSFVSPSGLPLFSSWA